MYPRELHRMRQPVVAVLSSGETMRDGLISSLSIVEASVAAQQQDDDSGPDPQGVTKYISADVSHPLPIRKPTSSKSGNTNNPSNAPFVPSNSITTGETVKGILKLGWMHKHQDVLPAVVVLVLGFDVDLPATQWAAMEAGLCANIQTVRDNLNGHVHIGFMVVLVQQRDYPKQLEIPEKAELALERIGTFCEKAQLYPDNVVLLYSGDMAGIGGRSTAKSGAAKAPGGGASHIGMDIKSLMELHRSIQELASSAYRERTKHVRAKIKATSRQSAQGAALYVRRNFKVAQMYEARQVLAKAVACYLNAYEGILGMVAMGVGCTNNSTAVKAKQQPYSAHEIKCVAEFIHFRLCSIYILNSEWDDAVAQFWRHIKSMSELWERERDEHEAKVTLEYRHWDWMARQHQVFAQLIQGYRPSRTGGTSFLQEDGSARSSAAAQQRRHQMDPALYIGLAAKYAVKRREASQTAGAFGGARDAPVKLSVREKNLHKLCNENGFKLEESIFVGGDPQFIYVGKNAESNGSFAGSIVAVKPDVCRFAIELFWLQHETAVNQSASALALLREAISDIETRDIHNNGKKASDQQQQQQQQQRQPTTLLATLPSQKRPTPELLRRKIRLSTLCAREYMHMDRPAHALPLFVEAAQVMQAESWRMLFGPTLLELFECCEVLCPSTSDSGSAGVNEIKPYLDTVVELCFVLLAPDAGACNGSFPGGENAAIAHVETRTLSDEKRSQIFESLLRWMDLQTSDSEINGEDAQQSASERERASSDLAIDSDRPQEEFSSLQMTGAGPKVVLGSSEPSIFRSRVLDWDAHFDCQSVSAGDNFVASVDLTSSFPPGVIESVAERIEVTMDDTRYNFAFVPMDILQDKSSPKSLSVLSSYSSGDISNEMPEFNVNFKLGCFSADRKPNTQAFSATLTAKELLSPSTDDNIIGDGIMSASDLNRDGLLGSVSSSGDGVDGQRQVLSCTGITLSLRLPSGRLATLRIPLLRLPIENAMIAPAPLLVQSTTQSPRSRASLTSASTGKSTLQHRELIIHPPSPDVQLTVSNNGPALVGEKFPLDISVRAGAHETLRHVQLWLCLKQPAAILPNQNSSPTFLSKQNSSAVQSPPSFLVEQPSGSGVWVALDADEITMQPIKSVLVADLIQPDEVVNVQVRCLFQTLPLGFAEAHQVQACDLEARLVFLNSRRLKSAVCSRTEITCALPFHTSFVVSPDNALLVKRSSASSSSSRPNNPATTTGSKSPTRTSPTAGSPSRRSSSSQRRNSSHMQSTHFSEVYTVDDPLAVEVQLDCARMLGRERGVVIEDVRVDLSEGLEAVDMSNWLCDWTSEDGNEEELKQASTIYQLLRPLDRLSVGFRAIPRRATTSSSFPFSSSSLPASTDSKVPSIGRLLIKWRRYDEQDDLDIKHSSQQSIVNMPAVHVHVLPLSLRVGVAEPARVGTGAGEATTTTTTTTIDDWLSSVSKTEVGKSIDLVIQISNSTPHMHSVDLLIQDRDATLPASTSKTSSTSTSTSPSAPLTPATTAPRRRCFFISGPKAIKVSLMPLQSRTLTCRLVALVPGMCALPRVSVNAASLGLSVLAPAAGNGIGTIFVGPPSAAG